jgi:hypothetical protein
MNTMVAPAPPCRRLRTLLAQVAPRTRTAAASSEAEDARVRRQDPGKKPADEHASSQSVAAHTVIDEQLSLVDTRACVVLPAVLSPAECDEIKAHLYVVLS